MNHIDLFAGIGGFSLGLKQAGIPINKHYFSEKDKYAISVYKRNFPDAQYLGAVESISGSGFPGGEYVVTFGFPCQDLSVAGKRKGFDGSRSSLFFEAMRIIDELRPSLFIFENVKGFYSSHDGRDFTIALQTIADLGVYECQWQLLNTAWFLPQNRERVYLVGSLRGWGRPEVFPITENNKWTYERNGKTSVANCLSAGGKSGGLHSNMCLIRHRTHMPYKAGSIAPALRNGDKSEVRIVSRPHGFNKGGEKTLPCLRASSFEHNEFVAQGVNNPSRGVEPRNDGLAACLKGSESGSQRPKVMIEKAPCIRAEHHNTADVHFIPEMTNANAVTPDAYLTRGARNRDENGKAVLTSMCDRRIRRLTPIEYERLQGFPDNWTQHGHEGQLISDTQRYKMCGNAVSVPVVREIGKKINQSLLIAQ